MDGLRQRLTSNSMPLLGLESAARDETMRNQLGDITDLVNKQLEMNESQNILMEERWEEKGNRRVEKDYRWIELRDIVNRIYDGVGADMEERRVQKPVRREAKDSQWAELRGLIIRINQILDFDRNKAEDARILAESKPGKS